MMNLQSARQPHYAPGLPKDLARRSEGRSQRAVAESSTSSRISYPFRPGSGIARNWRMPANPDDEKDFEGICSGAHLQMVRLVAVHQ